MKNSHGGSFKSEEARRELEKDITFVGLFGLEDRLRGSVRKSIDFAKKGRIEVRIVSGDALETAKRAAINAGLLTESEGAFEGYCMTGEDFRKKIGGLKQSAERNEEGNIVYEVENLEEFRKIAGKLKVLARSNPDDKLALVSGLK